MKRPQPGVIIWEPTVGIEGYHTPAMHTQRPSCLAKTITLAALIQRAEARPPDWDGLRLA
ncbi:MAG: hypothetical protein CMJ98_06005 [Planctomycetes bacterium]|jgi:hypothetical protein|nr:hypothetical protein [Planctomycetota bacterium]